MRPYYKLRGVLAEKSVTIEELTRPTGRSYPYLSRRFCNKKCFTQDDMLSILDYLELPLDKMGYYFSRDQKNGVKE